MISAYRWYNGGSNGSTCRWRTLLGRKQLSFKRFFPIFSLEGKSDLVRGELSDPQQVLDEKQYVWHCRNRPSRRSAIQRSPGVLTASRAAVVCEPSIFRWTRRVRVVVQKLLYLADSTVFMLLHFL